MQPHDYQSLLATSRRVAWRVDDLIGGDKRLDFAKPFLPETFARTKALTFLASHEKLALNHIRAHGYLAMFELVETFILPFISAQASVAHVGDDPFRQPAQPISPMRKPSTSHYFSDLGGISLTVSA